MTDHKLIRNFSALVVSNFSVQLLRFLTVVLLTRRLGPELFGVYNYTLLLISLCAIVVEFGLKNLAIREFSQGAGSWPLIKRIFSIRAVIAFFSLFIVAGLSLQAFRNSSLVEISLLFGISLFIDAFLVDFVAIAQEKLHVQALGQMLQSGFYLIAVYCLISQNDALKWIAVAFGFSHIIWIVAYLIGVDKIPEREREAHRDKFSFRLLIFGGLPFLTANIFGTLQSQMDIFLLGQFHYVSTLGDYSACLKLLSIPLGIVNSLISSVQPRLAKNNDNKQELLGLLKQYLKPLLAFVFLMNLVVFLFGNEIVHLIFGDKYIQAPLYLRPLSLVTSVFIITLLPMQALFVSRDTGKLLKITGLNFTLSLLTIVLTLYFKGPVMVPWAMLVVQIVCGAQAWRFYLNR